MFTGLIQSVGTIAAFTPNDFGARLVVDAPSWSYQPQPGDSIAVSGCCLTHAPGPGSKNQSGRLEFDVIAETLRKTRLGALKPGDRVNLESCLTPASLIGGHFVQGHVDAMAKVQRIASSAKEHRLTIAADESMMRYIVPTGSIAVEGVSLTLAAVDHSARTFDVALIPTTLQLTTLGDLREGDPVNLEADVLVKAAVNYMERVQGLGKRA